MFFLNLESVSFFPGFKIFTSAFLEEITFLCFTLIFVLISALKDINWVEMQYQVFRQPHAWRFVFSVLKLILWSTSPAISLLHNSAFGKENYLSVNVLFVLELCKSYGCFRPEIVFNRDSNMFLFSCFSLSLSPPNIMSLFLNMR